MYCPPPNSKLDVIFLSGDFNARTGELMNYVCNDSQTSIYRIVMIIQLT